MALPKLLQKLFTNGGAGDKLNQDIIPDIPYSKVTDAPSVDSALSSTSENPVQNKVINSALDGKLSTSGGTMTGDISFDGDRTIYNATNKGGDVLIHTAGVSLHGSNTGWLDGATLLLRSSSYTTDEQKGGFFLIAALSSSQNCELAGRPDGSLTWGSHNVITVVAESYSANSWYRKYSDGWIEQGGISSFPANEERLVITLPIAFISASYTITFCTNNSFLAHLYAQKATNFTVSRSDRVHQMGIWWYACGK